VTKVTKLGELKDEALVRELSARMKAQPQFLRFIEQPSRDELLRLEATDLSEQHKSIKLLWKLLLNDAITFLKTRDPREWNLRLGKNVKKEQKRSAKAFGVEQLCKYFEQFSEFERMLYGAEAYYHEHVLHVFKVWLLGTFLLDDNKLDSAKPITDFQLYLEEKLSKLGEDVGISKAQKEVARKKVTDEVISFEELEAAWCVIALTHDLGYPLQKTDTINDQTRKMLRQYGKVNLQDINFDVPQEYHFMNDFILRFISSRLEYIGEPRDLVRFFSKNHNGVGSTELPKFRTHIQPKYYLKFSKSLMDYEHGIVSAILLMKNLVYFLESDFNFDPEGGLKYQDARQSTIRREILRAIASHTCDEIYYVRLNTLSFLLILCDELQCWGRPTFSEIQCGDKGQESAELREFSKERVGYVLHLAGVEKDLDGRTKEIFQRLHKIFRTALDAPERDFECLVKIRGRDCSNNYTFKFKEQAFYWKRNGKDWDIWE
jgi:hypothetical protein